MSPKTKFLLISLWLSINAFSQNTPYSLLNDELLNKVNTTYINNPMSTLSKKPNDLELFNYTFAVSVKDSKLIQSGKWIKSKENEWIWILKIKAGEAKALSLDFKNLKLNENDKLYIYNKQNNVFNISDINIDITDTYQSDFFTGDNLTVEFDPVSNDTLNNFTSKITVNYAYKDVNNINSLGFGASDLCQINANCNEEENFDPEKNAVVRIQTRKSTKGSTYFGWCTGTIIANTSKDNTQYLITADHCYSFLIDGQYEGASEEDLENWEFYFNYESPTCENPNEEGDLNKNRLTGAIYKANSGMAGDTDSDFCLLELTTPFPEEYQVFWAGWDNSDIASPSGYSYHHPSADIKKINTYSKPLTSSQFDSRGPENTHWEVLWETGATEGGSSGSPLFNPMGQVVGVLTGGASSCSSIMKNDYFGKISYSWEYEPENNSQLKYWLDPANTGIEQMLGYDSNGVTKSLHFEDNIKIISNPITNGTLDFGKINPQLLNEVLVYDIKGGLVYKTTNPNNTKFRLHLRRGVYIVRTIYNTVVSVNMIVFSE
ncbi:MAG: trypsin-like peptidase domain-containing protein [Bacteroidota bacterium]